MKTTLRRTLQVFLILTLSWLPISGQTIGELFNNANAAMKAAESAGMPAGAAKWNEALGLLKAATDNYDKRADALFGPEFGYFWYWQGYSNLKLEKYGEATKCFEGCRKYKNADGAKSKNIFYNQALLRLGEASKGAEDWEQAIKYFKQFLAEYNKDDPADKFEPGPLNVNMAICYFNSGKLAARMEPFERALKFKDEYPTPPNAIVAGFQAFCNKAIENKDQKAIANFLKKHRADVLFEPWEVEPYLGIYLNLAGAAMETEMHPTAFSLFSLVPDSITATESTKALLSQLGAFERVTNDGSQILNRTTTKAFLESIEERDGRGGSVEISILLNTGIVHLQKGNIRGAYAAFDLLEGYHDNAPQEQREVFLYHLAYTASLIGRIHETEKYGQRYLDTYPGGQFENDVRRLMLSGLFYDGEYETCLEIATDMEPQLSENTEPHDICLHVLGGSLFNLGRFDEASEPLKRHKEMYPDSEFKVATSYFGAANLVFLEEYVRGGIAMDRFINDYPNPQDNVYLPFALFNRAECFYAQNEYEEALIRLNRIEAEFQNPDNIEQVYNLKGNVLAGLDKDTEAREYYEKGLATAEQKDNDEIAGESLFSLIALLAPQEGELSAEALPYYDKFWEKYGAESRHQAEVAVSAMPALKKANRTDEGIANLQGVISRLAKLPGAPGLEGAINSFTEFYLESHSEEELKDLYYNFPDISPQDRAAQALLRIALIGVYEERANQEQTDENEAEVRKARSNVKVLFTDLREDFDLPSLSNYILVSVGDYLREKTSSPKEAAPYYQEVLGRPDVSYRFDARFGLADVYGRSSNEKDQRKAVGELLEIYANSEENSQKEQGLYRVVEILTSMEAWDEVKTQASEYLNPAVNRDKNDANNLNFRQYDDRVAYLKAFAHDQLGESEDAYIAYLQVASAYEGNAIVSAPSVKRMLEILWARNQKGSGKTPADRQFAYDYGAGFNSRTRNFLSNPNVPEDTKEVLRELIEMVARYKAHPDVKAAAE